MKESCVDREKFQAALKKLAVPVRDVNVATGLLPPSALGILVYGSRARADFVPDSDLDLLALVENPRGSSMSGRVHVSYYTPEQLATARRTLFGMHLARDGVVVHDTGALLSKQLTNMGTPDAAALLARVRRYSAVLDVSAEEEQRYLAGLARVARYLLRTAIYAFVIAQGRPCFSVRELAERLGQPELAVLLSANPTVHGEVSTALLAELRRRLAGVVGSLETNVHGSLRALIVNEWDADRDRATLATLATASDDRSFDYAALPKVLL